MTLRTGFIGLGNQGKPIAAHLAPAGFEATVYDVVEAPMRELAAGGAKPAASPREVGERAELVGICVPEDKHVLSVMLGDDGLLAGMSAGGLVAIHSTVLPSTIEQVAAAAGERGIELIDACVTGGADGAAKRALTFLVGGPDAAVERLRPYVEAITDVPLIHAGPLGCGAKLKLCINLVTYIQFAAAHESDLLARAAGLDPKVLQSAGRSNGSFTPFMLAYLQSQDLPREVRESEAFQSRVRNVMHIAEKDLAWALQMARESEVSLPVGGLVSQLQAKHFGVDDPRRR